MHKLSLFFYSQSSGWITSSSVWSNRVQRPEEEFFYEHFGSESPHRGFSPCDLNAPWDSRGWEGRICLPRLLPPRAWQHHHLRAPFPFLSDTPFLPPTPPACAPSLPLFLPPPGPPCMVFAFWSPPARAASPCSSLATFFWRCRDEFTRHTYRQWAGLQHTYCIHTENDCVWGRMGESKRLWS